MKPVCKSRSVRIGRSVVAQTPLPLPSFSSQALDSDLPDTVARIGDIVFGPILISAFDLHHGNLSSSQGEKATFNLPLTFIDSGGYENLRLKKHEKLSTEQYFRALEEWPHDVRTVAVNYDCPSDDLGQQIESAVSLCPGRELGRELLLKPTERVPIAGLINQFSSHVEALSKIDVVGVTEKEAGASLVDQLRVIASLRQQLDRIGLDDLPVHIFGGLDPIRTPLYFLAGADIFDGLAWLRYGFELGRAVYIKPFAALEYPNLPLQEAEWRIRQSNFIEVTKLQTAMRKFMATQKPPDLHPKGDKLVALLDSIEL
ncbi:MAG TPA: hypothetical protein VHY35_03150 [Stellaceae bacterium]|jgi:hypothetical protein|nr:hypothetical protein [Stellaceae bacterium]